MAMPNRCATSMDYRPETWPSPAVQDLPLRAQILLARSPSASAIGQNATTTVAWL
jgi:hypothetical protein